MDEYTQNELQTFIKRLKINKNTFLFLDEIENVIKNYPDYSEKIKHPIDLIKIAEKVDNNEYKSLENFNDDIQLMINNCLTYNVPKTWAYEAGLSFQEYYNSTYEKLVIKIQKHNKKKFLMGKKRPPMGGGFKPKSTNSLIKVGTEPKIIKDDYSNMNSNITVLHYGDEKISKSIRNLFMSIKPYLNTSDENIENIVNTLIEGFTKSNKSNEDLKDIGTKFISKYMNQNEEKIKFLKDFSNLIRDMKNKQKEEATKLDQKTMIKIDLNENEANREERLKLEKIRKIVKKYIEEHKVPGIYLEKEEYSLEPELKKKIYNYVIGIKEKFTTGRRIDSKDDKRNIGIDDNDDLTNLD